jgi:hypothetical protein
MSSRYGPAIYGVLACAVGVTTLALQGVVVADADPSGVLLARFYGVWQLAAGIGILCLLAAGRPIRYGMGFAGGAVVLAVLHVSAGGLGPGLGWTAAGIALALIVLAGARAARRVSLVRRSAAPMRA